MYKCIAVHSPFTSSPSSVILPHSTVPWPPEEGVQRGARGRSGGKKEGKI